MPSVRRWEIRVRKLIHKYLKELDEEEGGATQVQAELRHVQQTAAVKQEEATKLNQKGARTGKNGEADRFRAFLAKL